MKKVLASSVKVLATLLEGTDVECRHINIFEERQVQAKAAEAASASWPWRHALLSVYQPVHCLCALLLTRAQQQDLCPCGTSNMPDLQSRYGLKPQMKVFTLVSNVRICMCMASRPLAGKREGIDVSPRLPW